MPMILGTVGIDPAVASGPLGFDDQRTRDPASMLLRLHFDVAVSEFVVSRISLPFFCNEYSLSSRGKNSSASRQESLEQTTPAGVSRLISVLDSGSCSGVIRDAPE